MGPARASPGGAAAPPSGGQAPSWPPPPPPGTGLAASAAPAMCRPRSGGAAAPVERLGRRPLGGAAVWAPRSAAPRRPPPARGPRCRAATAGAGLRRPLSVFCPRRLPSVPAGLSLPPSKFPSSLFFPFNFFSLSLLTSFFLLKNPQNRPTPTRGFALPGAQRVRGPGLATVWVRPPTFPRSAPGPRALGAHGGRLPASNGDMGLGLTSWGRSLVS